MTHFDGFKQRREGGVSIPPPPREVPRWFFVHRMKAAMTFGILLPGLGLVLAVVFLVIGGGVLPTADWAIDRNGVATEGWLKSRRLLRTAQTGGRHPWRVEFAFALPTGETMEGAGYLLVDSLADRAEGDALAIEYDPDDPSRSRPVGGSVALLRGVALWVIIGAVGGEVAVGALILLWALLHARRQRVLLEFGASSPGEVERVVRVAYIQLGKAHPYDVYYRFDDADRRPHRGRLRTYRYDWAAGLSPGSGIGVVYDPYAPQRNTLWLESERAGAA